MQENRQKSVILWLIRVGLFVVPFIPLYVSKVLFFPYITGKAFVFRIIVEIVFAAWVLLAIFYKEYRPKLSFLAAAIGIFILAVTLATIFGVGPHKSFWSNYERMEGLVAYLHLFAYFLVLGNVFKKGDWLIFFNLFVVAGILEGVYAILQRLGYLASLQGGIGRPDGTIGNPTYLAAYLLFVLGAALFLWLNVDRRPLKFYYGGAALFTLFIIYLTASRGPTLALIAGIIFGSIFYLIFSRKAASTRINKKILSATLILFLVFVAAVWLGRESSLVKNNFALSRLTLLSFSERTINSRFVIWGMAWEGFLERPIFGWGPDNFGLVFAKYFQPELWRQEPWFDRAHGIIFDWLVNAGILGLLAYLGILASAAYLLRAAFNQKKISLEEFALFATLFVVYFINNLAIFDQIATYISFFAFLAYIHSVHRGEFSGEEKPAPLGAMAGAAIALLVPLSFVFYFVNWKPLQANLSLLNALAVQSRSIPAAFENFQKALAYKTFGNTEIREQFTRFAIDAGGSPQASADLKDKILRTAIAEAQTNVLENVNDARAYLFLGTIYGRVGLADDALKIFSKAAELSPKKQQIYFEIADIYLKRQDYANAIKVLEQALELDPSFGQARMNLAAVYILNGQQAKADQLLIEGFGTVDVPDQLLIQIYSRVKNYPRLINTWKAFVKSDPVNISYRSSLAEAYLLTGQREEAVKVLEEAIKINPAFEKEGGAYIQQIRSGQ